MLLALTSAFALSQAFRTVAAILAAPLQAEFGLSAQALGLFAGAFHFAFGALQLLMGIGIDLQGVRRTVLAAFPLAIVGAGSVGAGTAPSRCWWRARCSSASGCAPAFLVRTVFIARQFPAERFAAVSGLTLGIGSLGMLLTGTPLAWLVQATSWRTGFWALGAVSVLAWVLILVAGAGAAGTGGAAERPSVLGALRSYGALFALPHTLGIIGLAWVTYASFISLRGLWLGPLLIERHGFSLVQSGNVAIAVSVVGMFGPVLFGRFDPGAARRRWIVGFTLGVAAIFGVMAFNPGGGARRGGPDRRRRALGLHRAAVRRREGGLPGRDDGPRDGGLHDGDVPRRGGDAVVHRRGGVRRVGARGRPVHERAADHRRPAGVGRGRLRVPAEAWRRTQRGCRAAADSDREAVLDHVEQALADLPASAARPPGRAARRAPASRGRAPPTRPGTRRRDAGAADISPAATIWSRASPSSWYGFLPLGPARAGSLGPGEVVGRRIGRAEQAVLGLRETQVAGADGAQRAPAPPRPAEGPPGRWPARPPWPPRTPTARPRAPPSAAPGGCRSAGTPRWAPRPPGA